MLQAPEGTTITVDRNEIFDFGEIDNIEPDAGEDPVEPTPTETKTITLDFASWPFTPVLGTSTTKIKTKDTYTLTVENESYEFEVYEPVYGYYYTGSALRFQNADNSDGDGGYIKFPAIEGMRLSELTVAITNGANKSFSVSTDGSNKGDVLGKKTVTKGSSATWSISNTEPNTSYYLNSVGSKTQIGKLILTYTKAN